MSRQMGTPPTNLVNLFNTATTTSRQGTTSNKNLVIPRASLDALFLACRNVSSSVDVHTYNVSSGAAVRLTPHKGGGQAEAPVVAAPVVAAPAAAAPVVAAPVAAVPAAAAPDVTVNAAIVKNGVAVPAIQIATPVTTAVLATLTQNNRRRRGAPKRMASTATYGVGKYQQILMNLMSIFICDILRPEYTPSISEPAVSRNSTKTGVIQQPDIISMIGDVTAIQAYIRQVKESYEQALTQTGDSSWSRICVLQQQIELKLLLQMILSSITQFSSVILRNSSNSNGLNEMELVRIMTYYRTSSTSYLKTLEHTIQSVIQSNSATMVELSVRQYIDILRTFFLFRMNLFAYCIYCIYKEMYA